MPQYLLTDRQKNLLRSIAPELANGKIKTFWESILVNKRDGSLVGIESYLSPDVHKDWESITVADLRRYVSRV